MLEDLREMTAEQAYAWLGIRAGQNAKAVKKAYYDKAKSMHPDKGGDKVSFQHLQHAHDMLREMKQEEHARQHQERCSKFWKDRAEAQQRKKDAFISAAKARAKEQAKQRKQAKPDGSVRFETVNPNAKGTLKEWLEYTAAHIVAVQEVKLTSHYHDAAVTRSVDSESRISS